MWRCAYEIHMPVKERVAVEFWRTHDRERRHWIHRRNQSSEHQWLHWIRSIDTRQALQSIDTAPIVREERSRGTEDANTKQRVQRSMIDPRRSARHLQRHCKRIERYGDKRRKMAYGRTVAKRTKRREGAFGSLRQGNDVPMILTVVSCHAGHLL